jgi:hypothetical protein
MTMRDDSEKGIAAGTNDAASSTADSVEARMLAFAEQLGRVVGTVQAKAEGWLDRDALNAQVAQVRDSAGDLLQYLGVKSAASKKPAAGAKPAARSATTKGRSAVPKRASAAKAVKTSAASAAKGRSGGVVDAPGKRHRKPTPNQSVAKGSEPRVTQLRVATANRSRRRR